MSKRRPLVAGNWKMNGQLSSAKEIKALVKLLASAKTKPKCDVLLCPPATLISPFKAHVTGARVALGGQDCHAEIEGAHTGDISAEMLKNAGARYVIVGHSERRADHGETSKQVAAKARAAYRAGLIAIICVGETAAERKQGATMKIVNAQIKASLPAEANAKNTLIAYEPVWAIGTGLTPSADDVAKVHLGIRKQLQKRLGDSEAQKMRVLYGGSVKATNAKDLMGFANVDGALVGGASLKAKDFWGIIEAYI